MKAMGETSISIVLCLSFFVSVSQSVYHCDFYKQLHFRLFCFSLPRCSAKTIWHMHMQHCSYRRFFAHVSKDLAVVVHVWSGVLVPDWTDLWSWNIVCQFNVLCHELARYNCPVFGWRWQCCAFRLLIGNRPIDGVVHQTRIFNTLFLTLKQTRSPSLRWEERMHGLLFNFFWSENNSFLSNWLQKNGKQLIPSLHLIDGSLEEVLSNRYRVHVCASDKIIQTQGRASRAIDRAPAPERLSLWNDLRNRSPGSPWQRHWSKYSVLREYAGVHNTQTIGQRVTNKDQN